MGIKFHYCYIFGFLGNKKITADLKNEGYSENISKIFVKKTQKDYNK